MKLTTAYSFLLGAASFMAKSVVINADLTYYIYIEEEEQAKNNQEDAVIVLRSVGSLPFDKSTFVKTGDACPDMVGATGGIHKNYLCAGASHPDDNNDVKQEESDAAFFPIAPMTNIDTPIELLPFKFASFGRSRGTPSGLIAWRNTFVVDVDVATSEDQPQFLDAVSMGSDTSKDQHNANVLSQHADGEVLGEWLLLDKVNGNPVEGGMITLKKGKPGAYQVANQYSTKEDQKYMSDIAPATANDAPAVDVADKISNDEAEEEERSCQSITEIICDDNKVEKFGTLCSLLMQVGLDEMLDFTGGMEQFTLYAPTNVGFERAFADKNQPSLLSGHDLTMFLLSHLIVSNTPNMQQSVSIGNSDNSNQSAKRYEDMVCGNKNFMASDQIVKTGCDENAEVAFLVGPGNPSNGKPKLLEVDQPGCNGLIHTIDYVILPSQKVKQPNSGLMAGPHSHGHNWDAVMEIEATEKNISMDARNNNAPTKTTSNENISVSNSHVMSFFEMTTSDLGGESSKPLDPITEEQEQQQPESSEQNEGNDQGEEPQQMEKVEDGKEPEEEPPVIINTSHGGFSSFFGSSSTEEQRGGNLRRR